MNVAKLCSDDFGTLIDLLPVGTLLSHDRIITRVNTAFARMFGYEPLQLIGKSLEMLYPSRREFIDRGEQWREFLSVNGGHCDERLMLCRGDRPLRMRVKGSCKDRRNPYDLVACAFEPALSEPNVPQITERERTIVAAMNEGMTSKEIARMLGLSHRTVETYRQRLMTKTGARNSSHLLALLR
jgi:DNA-binding CsgD family transcriptional regulator